MPVLYPDPLVEEPIGLTGQLLFCQAGAWSCCCGAPCEVVLYVYAQALQFAYAEKEWGQTHCVCMRSAIEQLTAAVIHLCMHHSSPVYEPNVRPLHMASVKHSCLGVYGS